MSRYSQGVTLAVALLALTGLGACAEPTTPTLEGPGISAARKQNDAFGSMTATTGWTGGTTTTDTGFVGFASWAPPLETYTSSFVYTVGQPTSHAIRFKDSWMEFLRLDIPRNAHFYDADGRKLGGGDTVRVSITVDSVTAAVQFAPHGARFTGQNKAVLRLSYFFLDLGWIPPTSLQIWYQPDDETAWECLSTQVEIEGYWLAASLSHFSNYAIAF